MYSVIKNPTAEQIGNEALRISMRRVGNTKNNVNEYIADAVAEKLCRDNPQPLTIEELQRMDGDPVWISRPKHAQGNTWGLLAGNNLSYGNAWLNIKQKDDSDWTAYRHKPRG